MIERIDFERPNVIAYEFHGDLTTEDIERVHDDLRQAIADHDLVRMYTDVTDMDKMEPAAVMEDLKLTPEYISDIDRYAIVGDERWHEWLTKAGDVISQGEARHFTPHQKLQAREWIRAM